MTGANRTVADRTVAVRAAGGQPRWLRGSRAVLVAAGALVSGYAVVGALTGAGTRPVEQVLFLVAVLLVHDVLVLPAVIGMGVLAGRFLPAAGRATVQVAGFVTVTLAVVAIPLVLGYGRRGDEPSALPLAYGRGLALILLLVWAATFTVLLRRHWRRRRGR